MAKSPRIAIIGAGLGGIPAAAMLQAREQNVTIYEQAPEFTRLGAGINLGPNIMKIMREIGIEEKLRHIGIEPESWASREWNTGKMQFEFVMKGALGRDYGAPYLTIHRGDFHAVLVETIPPETIQFGKRLIGMDEKETFVELSFDDGTKAEAEVVIGADGINSMVRDILLGPEEPTYTGFVAHRSIFPRALIKAPVLHDFTKWWSDDSHEADDDRHMIVYYLDRSREEIYIVSGVPDHNWPGGTSYVEADLDEMISVFDGFHDDLMQVLYACPSATKWPLFDRKPLPLWSEGRVVLLGDACHPMKPHLGQGAAMAAEDAVILVRCLEHYGYEDLTSAFALYETSRKARTSDVQVHSYNNQWMRHETNPDWVFGYDAINQELGIEAGVAGG
ncbi:MAG: FAD-dependent monooxygenase [Pseudomonadota bacterium]|nr:FAD-dependent monooxygenase [Pseudomonadota bacterium]